MARKKILAIIEIDLLKISEENLQEKAQDDKINLDEFANVIAQHEQIEKGVKRQSSS